jgi:hypothetical protein
MRAFFVSVLPFLIAWSVSLISVMNKAVVLTGALMVLSHIPASQAKEFTDREMAVKVIAGERTCYHLNPAGSYSFQNFMNHPEMEMSDEVKEEALIAEKSPDYQEEIQLAQDEMESDITGRAALGLLCSYYKPTKWFDFWR